MPSVSEKNSIKREVTGLVKKAKNHAKSKLELDCSLISNSNHKSYLSNKISFKLKLPYVYNISL